MSYIKKKKQVHSSSSSGTVLEIDSLADPDLDDIMNESESDVASDASQPARDSRIEPLGA